MDELYKDLLKDSKHQRTTLVAVLAIVIVLSICAITGLSLYYQNKITKLISETNTVAEYEVLTDNNSFNNGSITVTR